VLAGSPEKLWWRCDQGPDHEWQASPLALGKMSLAVGRRGCPFCAGKRASVTNSVASNPQLAAEWHPTANGDLEPDQVVAGTGARLWWRCAEVPEHEWQTSGANRLKGTGCPRCLKRLRSVLEVCLAFELADFLPEVADRGPVAWLTEDTVVVDGVIRHVDLLLQASKLVIEVDGRFRHDGEVEHSRDATKTDDLKASGYRVIRVREEPLRSITGDDVIVPTDATVKQVTDLVLTKLRTCAEVDLAGDIDAYLARAEPRHIDAALEHLKAERPGKSIRLPGPASFTRAGRWGEGMALLRTYVTREGHANVPWEHLENGVPLGKWVGAKRAQHRRGRMTADRVRELEKLPGWTWDAVADQWESGFRALLAFREREGHLDVPGHYWEADGFPLGSWVRSHRRAGGRKTMTREQRDRLEAIPGWRDEKPTDAAWANALEALTKFAERERHCRPSQQHRENGIDIDGWAARQRARFHAGHLQPDRVERLEAVHGWSWQPVEDAWEAGYEALERHIRDTGSTVVRRGDGSTGYPLRAWVAEQRKLHAAGDLPRVRRDRLERLPGWTWTPAAHRWELHFAALEAFVAREGHARVPTGHVEAGLPLASWVIRHRQEYKAGAVPAERALRLEALPGWTWDVLAARWEEHFGALTAFAAREGHGAVPSAHVEGGVKLGAWAVVQRHGRVTGSLSAERQTRLSQVPGWVWSARPRTRDSSSD
jgi:hypothetical protein